MNTNQNDAMQAAIDAFEEASGDVPDKVQAAVIKFLETAQPSEGMTLAWCQAGASGKEFTPRQAAKDWNTMRDELVAELRRG